MTSDLDRVLWVPVRHHSPAAAHATVALLRAHRPAVLLIEGPSDTEDLSELLRGHQLPISLMSWARWTDQGQEFQSYALYPFTEFSAEWQGVVTAAELGITTRFIDLPWADQLALQVSDRTPDRPHLPGVDAPGALQHEVAPSDAFYRTLTDYVGREDLAAVWDEFFEIAPLEPEEYLVRASTLGHGLRIGDPGATGRENTAREQHMAGHIRRALAETAATGGTVMVLTGAFHTAGLRELLSTEPVDPPEPVRAADHLPGLVTGQALVASSYEELDADRGYLAGQPSPGFYDRVFHARTGDRDRSQDVVLDLFDELVRDLRRRKVSVSVADSIAALATARGLQQIRSHARLWRDDLVDGITAAVVKDDLTEHHPLLAALATHLRGNRTGKLAAGTDVPPLVEELTRRWDRAGLPRGHDQVALRLDLTDPDALVRSHLLHLVQTLAIPAARLVPVPETSTTARTVVRRTEDWVVGWGPRSDTAAILASRWGGGGAAAAAAVLQHRALGADPGGLADVLRTSIAIGLSDLSGRLADGLAQSVRASSDFPALGRAFDVLVGFVHFDTWLGTAGRADLADLALTTQRRMVDVLAHLPAQGEGPQVTPFAVALRTLAEATGTLATELGLDVPALDRVLAAQLAPQPGGPAQPPVSHTPEVLGALQAARWLLSGDPGAALEAALGDPVGTGQFYSGLLTVAGHLALAAPQIFDAADEALRTWHSDDFLSALPDLRRAMAHLTSRERHALLRHLTGDDTGPGQIEVTEHQLVELARAEALLEQQVAHWVGTSSASSAVSHG